MSSKSILVIGSLSIDRILFQKKAPVVGETVVADKQHKELGGRGGNTAISASRAAHVRWEDGTVQHADDHCEVTVKLIAAVKDESYRDRFGIRMTDNLVGTDGIEVMHDDGVEDLDQDYMISIMDGATGQAQQSAGFEVSNLWPLERFDDIDKIASGESRPDLVIVTMELKTQIVEQIIETVSRAGIDVLLFATPGESIRFDIYPLITHVVCNESDAAKMLGYALEDVNIDTWSEVCNAYIRRGVKNVVIKLGPHGVYYKNELGEEGFASSHSLQVESEFVDQVGSTTAFVGPYAVEYVNPRGEWTIKAATERAIKASSTFSGNVGSEAAIPWSNEIDAVVQMPLYADLAELRMKLDDSEPKPFW